MICDVKVKEKDGSLHIYLCGMRILVVKKTDRGDLVVEKPIIVDIPCQESKEDYTHYRDCIGPGCPH